MLEVQDMLLAREELRIHGAASPDEKDESWETSASGIMRRRKTGGSP